MALSTVNFEQSGVVCLPIATFTHKDNILAEMEAILEQSMDVSTTCDTVKNVDWLNRMVMIHERRGNEILLMIGGEASVTIESESDIDDIEAFAYENLALSFEDTPWPLDTLFDVKHSEAIA